MFGATGGGRDAGKRPKMGSIAEKYSDKIILTTDDPYDDDPKKIDQDIMRGILMAEKAEIIVGANTDPLYKEKAQITVIPIIVDESAEPVKEKPQKKQSRKVTKAALIKNISKLKGEAIQLELPFENRSRGIFTSTSPTMYKGEDLDIPTFQRHEIHLDKGR